LSAARGDENQWGSTSMPATPTRFDDGTAYERMMGRWSRLAGEVFLDWLDLGTGLRWLDVGCGNGAFTELLVDHCEPTAVDGIDPSEGQLDYARKRPASRVATFQQGDAQALPFDDDTFDAAMMALVINLVPDPAMAVAEMSRVVRPGGGVATYMWDIPGGGFPMEPIRQALGEMGVPTPIFGAEVTRLDALRVLWESAGLDDVAVTRIDVLMNYDDFDDFWTSNTTSPNTVLKAVAGLSPSKVEQLRDRLRADLPTDPDGRVSYGAFANAVKGRVPGSTA
jgi:ubiquinone/menaquinone biosynthesis C-methylase UbiE